MQKNNNKNEIKQKRIKDIDKELASLKSERDNLIKHWKLEKDLIKSIRSLKKEVDNYKIEAERYERESNLAKVAEIRYGLIPEKEKALNEKTEMLLELQQKKKMLKEEVDADDIAEIVSKWTGIPLQKMLESEREKLLHIEEALSKRVIGQEEAVIAVSNAIRRSRAELQDERKPIGSFIFLGTTGVGKTELARTLADYLFDDEKAMIRIDMSEYMEKFSVSRLIGAPPGYVGYEEGGQLTESVRRKPYCVVLLDEIEKAHPDIFNVLLQVLDEGRLTDSKGKTVNFRNTIIIMTSNLGSSLIQEQLLFVNENNADEIYNELRVKLLDLLKSTIRPEFLNRIDEIIFFKPLDKKSIRKIVDLQLLYLENAILKKGYKLIVDDEVRDWIVKLGFDITYGARPIKRTIQRYITNPLSEFLLSQFFSAGDNIKVLLNKKGLIEFVKV